MELSKGQKAQIESQIVETIVIELEKGNLKEENLREIADFVLLKLDSIKNQNELVDFLSELSSKWPSFKSIEAIERGSIKAKIEKEVADGVLTLAQNDKIGEAISLAKSMTKTN